MSARHRVLHVDLLLEINCKGGVWELEQKVQIPILVNHSGMVLGGGTLVTAA